MRKIEKEMLAAVEQVKNYANGNTTVRVAKNEIRVYLHSNLIYKETAEGRFFTLAGWNTPTTRSRLNALGIDVRQKNFTAVYDGVEISSDEWVKVL